MQPNQSITTLLKRLWYHISPRRRGQFGLLLLMMLLASFVEILSIGAVLPFLAVSTAPERVFEHAAAKPIIQALGLTNETEEAVIQAIEGLGKDISVLIIAHRLTTLKNCTQIVELGSGVGIIRAGTYQVIVTQVT
jgi:hypothetical protein